MVPRKDCKTCDGFGTIPDIGVEPECCGNFDQYGGCCNNPNPIQVVRGMQPCPECEEVNDIEKEQITH